MIPGLIPEGYAFVSAGLFFLVFRSKDVQTIVKSRSQRTKVERQHVERGLRRSLFLELLVCVPASTGLLLLIAPLITPANIAKGPELQPAFYALLGLVSYGFPFATIRALVTRIALNTLKEFASLAPQNPTGGSEADPFAKDTEE